jgi:hypothetical protein
LDFQDCRFFLPLRADSFALELLPAAENLTFSDPLLLVKIQFLRSPTDNILRESAFVDESFREGHFDFS